MDGDEKFSCRRQGEMCYAEHMTIQRTSHAVYDTKYHLVWAPKYRKWILRGDIQERVRQIFEEIAINHGFAIDTMEVAQDHVQIFLSFPPRYSISKVVGMLKSISASVIFREYPEVKKQLWGEVLGRRIFRQTVGDKITAEVIRKYIQYHREQELIPQQLELF